MTDENILKLYEERNEDAILESSRAYGSFCFRVADRILEDEMDAEECVNETWWKAWNAIPPDHPLLLMHYLSKITRNLSLDCLRRKTAEKRGSGEAHLAIEELSECLSGGNNVEEEIDRKALAEIISSFLKEQPDRDAAIFVKRYFYLEKTARIASSLDLKESNVLTILSRMRSKLKVYLKKEGIEV